MPQCARVSTGREGGGGGESAIVYAINKIVSIKEAG